MFNKIKKITAVATALALTAALSDSFGGFGGLGGNAAGFVNTVAAESGGVSETDLPTVESFAGTVKVRRGGGMRGFSAYKGMKVGMGDTVITGANSSVKLTYDKKELLIGSNSTVFFNNIQNSPGCDISEIYVIEGSVESNIKKKLEGNSRNKVSTANAIAGVRGTRFVVGYSRLDDEDGNFTKIFTLEGRVKFDVTKIKNKSKYDTYFIEADKIERLKDSGEYDDVDDLPYLMRLEDVDTQILEALAKDTELMEENPDLLKDIESELEERRSGGQTNQEQPSEPINNVIYEFPEAPATTPATSATTGMTTTPATTAPTAATTARTTAATTARTTAAPTSANTTAAPTTATGAPNSNNTPPQDTGSQKYPTTAPPTTDTLPTATVPGETTTTPATTTAPSTTAATTTPTPNTTTTPKATTTTPKVTTTPQTTTTPKATATTPQSTATSKATTTAPATTTSKSTTTAPDTTTSKSTTTAPDTTTSKSTTTAPDTTTSKSTTTAPDTTTSKSTTTAPDTTTAKDTTTAPNDTTTPKNTTTAPEDTTTAKNTTTAPNDTTTAKNTTTSSDGTTTADDSTTAPDTTTGPNTTDDSATSDSIGKSEQVGFDIKTPDDETEFPFNAPAIDLTVINSVGELTFTSSDTSVASVNEDGVVTFIKPGTVDITVTASGDGTYKEATATITIKVLPADIADVVSAITDSFVYDGTAQKPNPVDPSVDKEDYTITYIDNTNAGDAIILIEAVVGGNYKGSKSVGFTISRRTLQIEASNALSPIDTVAILTFTGLVTGDNPNITLTGGLYNTVYRRVTYSTGDSVKIAVGNANYIVDEDELSLKYHSGLTAATSIPVTQLNIVRFNTHARTAGGLSKYYHLTDDLVLNPFDNNTWSAIGTHAAPFIGCLDGKGYSISTLHIDEPAKDFQGVFAVIGTGGTVKDFSLVNCDIKGKNYVGAIAGENKGTITGCNVSGVINGNNYVGGIAGLNSGTIEECEVTGNVKGKDHIGGIAGRNEGSVLNCTLNDTVTGVNTLECVGGIVGSNAGLISDCKVSGEVKAPQFAGGIAGWNETAGEIKLCTILADISGALIGGIAAANEGTISYCYFLNGSGEVDGSYIAGGIVGANLGKVENCGVTGNVGGVIALGIGDNYSSGIGGVAGFNAGKLLGCEVSGKVTGEFFVGGIVGSSQGTSASQKAEITGCTVTGGVVGYNTVGGIVGVADDTIIKNCEVKCDVTGKTVDIGGIAGRNNDYITNCKFVEKVINDGNLTTNPPSDVGGIAGLNNGTIDKCVVERGSLVASNGDNTGGIAGLNSGTISDCVALNSLISGTSTVCRIANKGISSATLTNNYALSTMTISKTLIKGLNADDGADVTTAQLTQAWWTARGFTDTWWTGKLPIS